MEEIFDSISLETFKNIEVKEKSIIEEI